MGSIDVKLWGSMSHLGPATPVDFTIVHVGTYAETIQQAKDALDEQLRLLEAARVPGGGVTSEAPAS